MGLTASLVALERAPQQDHRMNLSLRAVGESMEAGSRSAVVNLDLDDYLSYSSTPAQSFPSTHRIPPSSPIASATSAYSTCPSTPINDSDPSRDILSEVGRRLSNPANASTGSSSFSISTRDTAFSSNLSPGSQPPKHSQLVVPNPGESNPNMDPTLFRQLEAIGSDAIAAYESLKTENLAFPPNMRPFSTFSTDDMEGYFNVAVDAKNILNLRRYAIMIDIGYHLDTLVAKLSRYDQDTAALEFVSDEIKLIKKECHDRSMDINFTCLEYFRSMNPAHSHSFMEDHSAVCSKVMDWEEGAKAYNTTIQFLEDPAALREYRLRTMQR